MPATLDAPSLLKALEAVKDPDLGRSIVEMGMIKEIVIAGEGSTLAFTCELTTPACPAKEQIEREIRARVAQEFPQVKTLEIKMTGAVKGPLTPQTPTENPVPQIRNVVLIASARGGTGKSTLALNIALALYRSGASVGLLDLDIYAPTLPRMALITSRPKLQGESKIVPIASHGLEVMSMGFLVEARQPLIWRGQILAGLVAQFLRDVVWSERDYLIVDLPPGSGELALAFGQACPVSGVLFVTTPTQLSATELFRTKAIFDSMKIPALGLCENFAYYPTLDGKLVDYFPRGAAYKVAEELQIPHLGDVPFDPRVAVCGDEGRPYLVAHPEAEAAVHMSKLAEKLAAQVSITNLKKPG